MKLIKQLISEVDSSLDAIPADAEREIKKNIRRGAEDTSQRWHNALHLVHQAFKVAGVQRPTPDMKSAWKTYEEMIKYSVNQLAASRGVDGDWRMSSAAFTEGSHNGPINVEIVLQSGKQSYLVESDILSLIEQVERIAYDRKVSVKENDGSTTITFSKWGVREGVKIRLSVPEHLSSES